MLHLGFLLGKVPLYKPTGMFTRCTEDRTNARQGAGWVVTIPYIVPHISSDLEISTHTIASY